MILGRTAVELEIGAGTSTSGLEYTAVLNIANGQIVGQDRVVVDVENGYVDDVAAAAAASAEVVWTQTYAHIVTVICVIRQKKSIRSESCMHGMYHAGDVKSALHLGVTASVIFFQKDIDSLL